VRFGLKISRQGAKAQRGSPSQNWKNAVHANDSVLASELAGVAKYYDTAIRPEPDGVLAGFTAPATSAHFSSLSQQSKSTLFADTNFC
jgi:hypothetical protein